VHPCVSRRRAHQLLNLKFGVTIIACELVWAEQLRSERQHRDGEVPRTERAATAGFGGIPWPLGSAVIASGEPSPLSRPARLCVSPPRSFRHPELAVMRRARGGTQYPSAIHGEPPLCGTQSLLSPPCAELNADMASVRVSDSAPHNSFSGSSTAPGT
jgi:hypothetical protein